MSASCGRVGRKLRYNEIDKPPSSVEYFSVMEHPETIGPYQLLSLIGTGGMSRVYRARKLGENRYYAIKVLSLQRLQGSPKMLSRFRRECDTLTRLEHPHIVRIREAGESDGQHFLVMELLPGETLKTALARGPLATPDLVRLMYETTSAMAYCHERGILHRDLKPSNIFRVFDGTSKILDFGLAKGQTDERITIIGRRIGTPRYMAPEVVRGHTPDERSEVYQLGLIFYEAATARAAYPDADVPVILKKVLSAKFPPLEEAAPALPEPLRTVIHRCIQKEAFDRYPSVRELELALPRGMPNPETFPEKK
jgi:serine/threonine protein kinase